MTPDIAREFGITLKFIRESLGVSQAKLGELSHVSSNLINDYEHFRKPLHRERLEYLLSFVGVPPERIEATLTCLEDNRAAARAPGAAGYLSTARRGMEAVVQKAGGLAMDFTRGLLNLLTLEGEGLQARQRAEVLWVRLKRHPPATRLLLVAAREARVRSKKLWEAGASADPGLLNEALVLQIEANLLLADRRFAEALKLVEDALRIDSSGITARLLYTKARILEDMDDLQGSTTALEEAASLVDVLREPRFALGIRLQLLLNLCLADRAAEAQHHLGKVRSIAEKLNKELDLTRVLWVEGLAAAGVGQCIDAKAKLQQVRGVMAKREIAYDYALVTLDLAVVLLAENRAQEVRALTTDLVWIFRSQQLSENALAALRLFTEATRQESATVGLARRIRRFLYRAQQNPELEFKETGAGE